jgi:hypothetical protein
LGYESACSLYLPLRAKGVADWKLLEHFPQIRHIVSSLSLVKLVKSVMKMKFMKMKFMKMEFMEMEFMEMEFMEMEFMEMEFMGMEFMGMRMKMKMKMKMRFVVLQSTQFRPYYPRTM